MNDRPRLIEAAFPLKQASLDSVHEKNVRHGHISTLHIWPARRPLAACRAALIATLLPDPGTDAERKRLLERLAGVAKTENAGKSAGGRKVPVLKEYTEGGILHWGRENGLDLEFFREEIRKAYGGRAPRVLDPFAGGGAIPLEAMRLGCEVTAADINPVAWFILRCTLEYPQKLAGKTWPLPRFTLECQDFMSSYWKNRGDRRKNLGGKEKATQSTMLDAPQTDVSWHVRAWGRWVLERAQRDLERFYPAVDARVPVAYLWARTVKCKNCRATIPLLKTLWLCKKGDKRFRLELKRRGDRSGVEFEVVAEPVKGGNAAQRRAHDLSVGRGTMSRSGAWCPVCGSPSTVAMTRHDIQTQMRDNASSGVKGTQMTAVVVESSRGKQYRSPTSKEISAAEEAAAHVDEVFRNIPFGVPSEPIFEDAKGNTWCVTYGSDRWCKLFTPRQLLALGTLVGHTRAVRDAMRVQGYPDGLVEAVSAYLAIAVDRVADRNSMLGWWQTSAEKVGPTFTRWALPITWDFVEIQPSADISGGYTQAIEWVADVVAAHAREGVLQGSVDALQGSAICAGTHRDVDVVLTDPPYYDAIAYSNLMDFYYVWLKRMTAGLSKAYDIAFSQSNCPKWNATEADGELIDDASRFGGSALSSKKAYEQGMCRAFDACWNALTNHGLMVVVFANKQPDAWETLASSMIRAGFVVEASWPIQTERVGRVRSYSSAALSSSVWLVCRKRPDTARPGWDNQVLEEMRSRIHERLREFWDANIRGPDFVWAATGPALEAYSKHPVVKKADEPNSLMTVSEFLRDVRRIVVDYVVGQVLSRGGDSETAENLDDLTLYYLLHRNDFGMDEAPVGASILYAQSCDLRDRDLVDRYDLLAYGKGKAPSAEADAEEEDDAEEGAEEEPATSGSTVKLKRWDQRRRKDLGLSEAGRSAPLIDQVHRIMQLWKGGEVQRVDGYLEEQGLRRNSAFPRVLQALIELARKDSQPDEVSLLESVMNHVTARGMHPQMRLMSAEES